MVRRGLVASRSEAQEAIARGRVTIDGAPALKPSTQVQPVQDIVLLGPPRPYVSRGGEKLGAALEEFLVDPGGRRCLDAGASTGGFTDCLLQHRAAHVVAVDVGYGQLHQSLRDDDRVTMLERTNVRALEPGDVPPPAPTFVVADLSFISLALVLPALRAVAAEDAEAVVLVKPQFEARREDVGKGGVVRDPQVQHDAVRRVVDAALTVGWRPAGVIASPLRGPAGNVEFLVHLVPDGGDEARADVDEWIRAAVGEAHRTESGGR